MTLVEGSKKNNKQIIMENIEDTRIKVRAKSKVGDFVGTADLGNKFSKNEKAEWSYEF